MDWRPIRTSALHHVNLAHHAWIVEEAGWEVPSVYPPLENEVQVLHSGVGLCDTSSIGKFDVKGREAFEFLRKVYGAPVPERVGDLQRTIEGHLSRGEESLLARLAEDHFYLVSTAGAAEEVLKGLMEKCRGWRGAYVFDMTSAFASITVAGPRGKDVLSRLTSLSVSDLPGLAGAQAGLAGVYSRLLKVRKVFHLHVPFELGVYAWESLMEAGDEFDIAPFGSEAWRSYREHENR